MDEGCKIKRVIKEKYKIFDLNNRKVGVIFLRMEK